MNTFKTFALLVLISASSLSSLTSFTSKNTSSSEIKVENITFKIINNMENDWSYCSNGSHNTIGIGITKTMTYPEGAELRHLEKGNCTAVWFKVTSAYNGKTFKLNEMMK